MAINRQFIFDADLEVKDAGLVATSAAAQVDSAAKILDIGEGFVEGSFVIDVTAVEVASGDEVYTIILEGSTSATFASTIVPLAMTQVGDADDILGACDVDGSTGRYVVPFRNERDGTIYPYVRGYTVVAGSIATGGGINWAGFLSKTIGG